MKATPPATAAALHYLVTPARLHAHRWHITLTIARPQATQRG